MRIFIMNYCTFNIIQRSNNSNNKKCISRETVATGAREIIKKKQSIFVGHGMSVCSKEKKKKDEQLILIAKCINYKKHDTAIRPKT